MKFADAIYVSNCSYMNPQNIHKSHCWHRYVVDYKILQDVCCNCGLSLSIEIEDFKPKNPGHGAHMGIHKP